MATLSKHGDYKVIERLKHKEAYCQDGTVLRNYGDGWRVRGKLKPGRNYLEVYEKAILERQAKAESHPAFYDFVRTVMSELPGLRARTLFLLTLEAMPDDPDGIWAELRDAHDYRVANIDLDIDTINTICRKRELALQEQNFFQK